MAKSRFFLQNPQKGVIFAYKTILYMQTKILSPMVITHREQLIKDIEESGILIVRKVNKAFTSNEDFVFPHIIITLCLSGSARAMYDMREITHHQNDLTIFMPGHILHPIGGTDDFSYALLFISPKMFEDLRFSTFSHDYEKYNYAPVCSLTDEQAAHLLTIVDLLTVIAKQTDEEMPYRRQTLLAQLAVGYEFLNCYRREQDREWTDNRNIEIYSRFCDLVVKNYRESREVKFYAGLLNLTPKYLSKAIRAATGGVSPVEWIEQYVIAQAKRLIEISATPTLQETAYMLGFFEPTSFYRYFKRITGMTAKQYLDFCQS